MTKLQDTTESILIIVLLPIGVLLYVVIFTVGTIYQLLKEI